MGYVRNTYGCHCFYGDSSFKRYNRHCGGDTVIFNYNSGNTYNACCGGGFSGGNWFSNLMAGFGMGLGGYFGNMFGGMGMGNMFGGFGMGGFGFPMFGGGFGNWGLGGGNRAADTTGTPSTKKSADDKDYAKLNDLHAEANKLVKDIHEGKIADPAKAIDDLNQKLDDYKKLDKKQTAENDEQIENIKKQLADAKAALDATPASQTTSSTTSTPANGNSSSNQTAGNIEGVPTNLTYDGFTNYTEEDFESLKAKGVVLAWDEADNIKDVKLADKADKTATVEFKSNEKHPSKISIKDKDNNFTYTYTYKGKTSKGEYVYKSTRADQLYLLQKGSDGEFSLRQYSGMLGYGISDEKPNS